MGLGIKNRKIVAYLKPFVGTRCSVSLDSNWITANVGRKGKSNKRARRYTRAQDAARAVMGTLRASMVGAVKELGLLIAFGFRGVLTWRAEPSIAVGAA